ncbi:hypothetical protein PENSPDRAFT_740483 [Peniophora sp. CONT]|nr:hypothetical protein PENSPDRAFT_740483 [Peniophora sp. CONT]
MTLNEATGSTPRAYNIDMLPPELIRRIFICTQACEMADYMNSSAFYPDQLLEEPPLSISRSQVSRRWREIALSCQELWNDWPRYGKARYWTDICHTRSSQAPLNLSIIVSSSELGPSATARRNLALGEISRVRTLLVELQGPHSRELNEIAFRNVLDDLSRSDTPWLESLTMRNHLLRPPAQIPVSLFQSKPPPRLHTVFIDGFQFRSSDKIWPENLCVLDMRDACAWSTVDEMIDFFKAVPNLEELTYSYDQAYGGTPANNNNFSPSTKHSIRSAPLPRLKRFCLLNDENNRHFGYFVPGISMFSYLALPSSVALDMSADRLVDDQWIRRWDDATDVRTLTGPVAENFVLGCKALRAHFADAAKKGQSYDAVTVKDRIIQPDLERQVSDRSALPSTLTLVLPHVPMQGRNGRVSRIACSLYLFIPVFQGTTELDVTRTRECRPFLHRSPPFLAVRILTLTRKAAKDFVQPPRFSTYANLFPALEIIRFKDFDCDESVEPILPPGPRPRMYAQLRFPAALLETLVECDKAGLCGTWKRIEFEGCANGEGVAEGIREDARLRRFNEQVVVVCENSEDYEPHGWSDRSSSTRSDHSDEEE